MDFNVEEISPVKRIVHVHVPVEEVDASFSATLAIYRRTVEMPGFRKGKVPSSMLEGRFCKQIRAEATQDLISLHINEILNLLKLNPVSRIELSDASELVRGEAYNYSFSFEAMPELELPEYTGIEVTQERVKVNPVELEAVFERLREQMADYIEVKEDRPPVDGEAVVVSFKAFSEGGLFPVITADDFTLVLGKGQALPQFEEALKILRPTQTVTTPMTFPEDFLNKELAGKTVSMEIKLRAIKLMKLPEVDDDLAKKACGVTTVAQMREVVEKSYLDSLKQLCRASVQKKLLDVLLGQVDFFVPESMVERHVDHMLYDLKGRMESRGKRLEVTGKALDELQARLRLEAVDLVRAEIFLLAVAKDRALTVSDQELDAYFRVLAARSGEDYCAIRKFYESNNFMFAVRDRLLADKAMGIIYDSAVIRDSSATEADVMIETATKP